MADPHLLQIELETCQAALREVTAERDHWRTVAEAQADIIRQHREDRHG